MDPSSLSALNQLTVKKLYDLCKYLSIPSSGRKQELVQRIKKHCEGNVKSIAYDGHGSIEEVVYYQLVEKENDQESEPKEMEEVVEQVEVVNRADQEPRNCALCLQDLPNDWNARAVIEKMVIVLKADSFPTTPLVLKPSSTCHETSTDICRGCFISNEQLYKMQFKDQIASMRANDKHIGPADVLSTTSPSKSTSMPLSLLTENQSQNTVKSRVPRPYKVFDQEDIKTMIRNSPVKSKSYKRINQEDGLPSPSKRSRLYDLGK